MKRHIPLLFLSVLACTSESPVLEPQDGSVDITPLADATDAQDTSLGCVDDALEPNDTREDASATAVGNLALDGVLCPDVANGNADVFSFEAVDTSPINVFIGSDQGTISGRVVDEAGAMVLDLPAGGVLSHTFTPAAPGMYFLQVSGCCASRIEYSVRLTYEIDAPCEITLYAPTADFTMPMEIGAFDPSTFQCDELEVCAGAVAEVEAIGTAGGDTLDECRTDASFCANGGCLVRQLPALNPLRQTTVEAMCAAQDASTSSVVLCRVFE